MIAITWTDEYQAIIALPASGITTIKDLKDRKVGVPKHAITIDHNRASAHRAFEVALGLEGLSLADVEVIDLDDARYAPTAGVRSGLSAGGRERHSYTNEAFALARGEVDAVYVKDVRGAELAYLLGAVVVADLGFHPDPFVRLSNCTPRPLTVSGELLDQRPDLVDRFLARVVRAGEWAATHPDETVLAISRETGWSERWVRCAYGDQVHHHLAANLDPASVTGLGQFINDLARAGAIPNDFDVNDWIDPAPRAPRLQRAVRLGDRDRPVPAQDFSMTTLTAVRDTPALDETVAAIAADIQNTGRALKEKGSLSTRAPAPSTPPSASMKTASSSAR